MTSATPGHELITALITIADDTTLTKRERGVLMMRTYGLSLDAIAAHYEVTRERIRQIERKGRDKLTMTTRSEDSNHPPE